MAVVDGANVHGRSSIRLAGIKKMLAQIMVAAAVTVVNPFMVCKKGRDQEDKNRRCRVQHARKAAIDMLLPPGKDGPGTKAVEN